MPAVDWPTRVITVPQSDLVQIGPTLYELDIEVWRRAMRVLEASSEGIVEPPTHSHNPPATVSGITLAQVVLMINSYTLTFEDGQYGVDIVGGNSNLADFLNRNSVSVNTRNSAGLIITNDGGGSTETADCVVSATIGLSNPGEMHLMAWLRRNGEPVAFGLVGATIEFLDDAGSVVVAVGAMIGPNSDGMFRRTVSSVSLAAPANFYAKVTIEDAQGSVTSYTATPTIG